MDIGFDSQRSDGRRNHQVWDYSSLSNSTKKISSKDLLYASSRPIKRRRRTREEEEEEIYSSRPVKRRREDSSDISSDGHVASNRRRRRRREDNRGRDISSKSCEDDDDDEINRRRTNRREETNSRGEVINYRRSSSIERRRREDSRSSNKRRRTRRREESNSDSGGEVIDHSRSSSIERRRRRRRKEESNSKSRDVSLDSRSSNKKNRRREEISSKSNRCIEDSPNSSSDRSVITEEGEDIKIPDGITKCDDVSCKSNQCRHDDSPNSCSGGSVVTEEEEDIDFPVGSTKCDDVSCMFCQDETSNAESGPVGSFPCFVDDGLVTQILTRLPVKSLCRFKSVCKSWRSLITQDPHFTHLQLTGSESRPKLLCIAPLRQEMDGETLPQRILSANMSFRTTAPSSGEGETVFHKVKKTTDDSWFHYDYVLGPVNGLVCFIDWGTAAARIYNVGTREESPWIKSTLLVEEKDKFESQDNLVEIVSSNHMPIYQMGFDPEKKEQKLFCFWRLSPRDDPASSYLSWEALTVGRDTKWRRISVVPDENNLIKIKEVLPPHFPAESPKTPANANGTIYWRNKRMSSEYDLVCPESVFEDYAPTEPDVIIALDVGSEKYRVIPIPSFILDEPREKKLNRPVAMLVLGGRVTLVYQMSDFVVKLWMLDDDGAEKKLENCQGKGSCNWSAESVTLPFQFDTRFLEFHGVPTRPDIILISGYGEIGGSEHPKVDWLYSYDRNAKTTKLLKDMDRSFSLPLHHNRSLFTTFTESLIPVQPAASTRRSELDFY